MFRIQILSFLFFQFLVAFSNLCAEQLSKQELVRRSKPPTAKIVVGSRHGTAFCIDPSGLFLTCEYIVREAPYKSDIKLILNSGQEAEKTILATVMNSNQKTGIALLKATTPAEFSALKIGTSDGLVELSQVLTVGYPNLVKKSEPPSLSLARITSLRKTKGMLSIIQIDSNLEFGFSGGPLIAEDGTLIGMVMGGISGAQINIALPAGILREFLLEPVVELEPKVISTDDYDKPIRFVAQIPAPSLDLSKVNFKLTLTDQLGTSREFDMKAEGKTHSVSVIPNQETEKLKLTIHASYEQGKFTGTVLDQVIKLREQNISLKDIRKIEFGTNRNVRLKDGTSLSPTATDFIFPVTIAGQTFQVDLSQAQTVEISIPPTPAIPTYTYSIIVTKDDKELGRFEDILTRRHLNILVVKKDKIEEYSREGKKLNSITVPKLEGWGVTESVRDICYTPTGKLFIYNGTFRPVLTEFFGNQWTHHQCEGWSTINNGSYGGIATYGDFVYVGDMRTAKSHQEGVIQFDMQQSNVSIKRSSNQHGYIDLAMGHDNLLYTCTGTKIDVYNPKTLELLRSLPLQIAVRAIAANSEGELFSAGWDGRLARHSKDGKLIRAVNAEAGSLSDINLSSTGEIIACSRSGEVVITNNSLTDFKKIRTGGTFVCFGTLSR